MRLESGIPEPVCPQCRTPIDVGLFRQDVPVGHPDFGKPAQCPHPFHQPAREERMAKISQLGPEDVKTRLSDIVIADDKGNQAMLEAAAEITERGYGWLYVWGGPGNAKSEMLKAVVNQMNAAGRGPAIYTTFGRLLMYMRAAFDPDAKETEMQRFDRLVNVRVLAVDEIEKPKITEWSHSFRFDFLDARYTGATNRITLTLFAGNTNPEEIFDEVILDRFQDGRFKIVQNTAGSARKYMRYPEQQK